MKRNGETVEYQVALNIPHLRGKNQQNLRESPCFLREWRKPVRFWLSQRTCLSLCGGSRETGLPSQSRSARQLSHRESPWQAGQLPTGRLSPDMAQKGGPCYRRQARLCTTSPSRLRRATSPCRRGFGRPCKVNGFARGSPTRGAVERSETERLYEGKPDREPPAGLPSPSLLRNDTSPKGRGFGRPGNFPLTAESSI